MKKGKLGPAGTYAYFFIRTANIPNLLSDTFLLVNLNALVGCLSLVKNQSI